jgi:hypothetical protein
MQIAAVAISFFLDLNNWRHKNNTQIWKRKINISRLGSLTCTDLAAATIWSIATWKWILRWELHSALRISVLLVPKNVQKHRVCFTASFFAVPANGFFFFLLLLFRLWECLRITWRVHILLFSTRYTILMNYDYTRVCVRFPFSSQRGLGVWRV